MQAIHNDTFDPVALSIPENVFLVEHLGKPPAVVARVTVPDGVNPKAVMPVIEAIYALEEIKTHDKEPWTGVEPLKAACKTYIKENAGWNRLREAQGNGFPRFPTMAGWDSKGKPAMGAVGSDSGYVRTYFDENGDRKRFAVPLHGEDTPTFLPPWIKTAVHYDKLIENDTEGWIRCPICQHTERYQNESQSNRSAAQGRMARHLLTEKKQADAHRELHTKVYGR